MVEFIKGPQELDIGVAGIRGLSARWKSTLPYIVNPWPAPAAASAFVPLSPGEEVQLPVTLAKEIPIDANFTKITASLIPDDDTTTETQISQKAVIAVDGDSSQTKTFDVKLTIPMSPSTVTIRLKGGEVFWTFGNVLTDQAYSLPELQDEVNAYLDRMLEEDGEIKHPIELVYLVRSESRGKVKMALDTIAFSRFKTKEWFNELDGTTRVDRNLELEFAARVKISLDPLVSAPGASLVLRRIRMDIGGEFGPERLLGGVAVHDEREFATVTSEYALAQAILLSNHLIPKSIKCSGISALFVSDSTSEIYVEIQNDADGAPASGEPLAQTNLTLSKSEPGVDPVWAYASFPSPVDLHENVLYWLVIKGVQGRANLAFLKQEVSYLGSTLVNRGGALWKPFYKGESDTLPMLRLVYLPEIDNQSAAISLRIEGTTFKQPFHPGPEADSLSLAVPDGVTQAELLIESQARGRLSLANVIQEYAAQ